MRWQVLWLLSLIFLVKEVSQVQWLSQVYHLAKKTQNHRLNSDLSLFNKRWYSYEITYRCSRMQWASRCIYLVKFPNRKRHHQVRWYHDQKQLFLLYFSESDIYWNLVITQQQWKGRNIECYMIPHCKQMT